MVDFREYIEDRLRAYERVMDAFAEAMDRIEAALAKQDAVLEEIRKAVAAHPMEFK